MRFARRARRWMTIPGAGIAGGTPLYLTGATWAIDGNGRAYNTPTLGAELLTDGGLENWATATNLTSWVEFSGAGSSVNRESISVHGGTYAARLDIGAGAVVAQILQTVASGATEGTWVLIEIWAKSSPTGKGTDVLFSNTTLSSIALTGDYTKYTISGRSTSATPALDLKRSTVIAANSSSLYFDDVSVKSLALATLLATKLGNANNLIASARISALTAGTQAGAIGWLDDTDTPANFVIAYHDGTTAKLDKCVAGTYTNLISISSTFVQGAAIEIRRPSGNTFQLWYNGSQVGTDQTISDTAIADNATPYYGAFSTYEGNTFTQFTLDGTEYLFPGA